MHERAVLAQVQVPAIGINVQTFFLNAMQQLVVIVLALRTADDLAVPFRRQAIRTEHRARIVRILLHVERFGFLRIIADEDRRAVVGDEQRLVLGAEIFAPDGGTALLLQRRDGVRIRDARKRADDRLEMTDVALEHRQLGTATLQDAMRDGQQQLFLQLHAVVHIVEGHLRFDHPELGEVTARLRLLGAKCGAEGVDATHRGGERFTVELTRLREICVAFVEVLGAEEPRALADRSREDRCVAAREVAFVEEIVNGLLDLVTHTHQRDLTRRTQPEVPIVHQEIDAMLLRLDRVVDRTRTEDRDVDRADFRATRCTRFKAHVTGHGNGGLECQRAESFPHLRRYLAFHEDTLHGACAITHHEKGNLTLRSDMLHPATHRYGRACRAW